jgi:hypothetical protein
MNRFTGNVLHVYWLAAGAQYALVVALYFLLPVLPKKDTGLNYFQILKSCVSSFSSSRSALTLLLRQHGPPLLHRADPLPGVLDRYAELCDHGQLVCFPSALPSLLSLTSLSLQVDQPHLPPHRRSLQLRHLPHRSLLPHRNLHDFLRPLRWQACRPPSPMASDPHRSYRTRCLPEHRRRRSGTEPWTGHHRLY